MYRYVGHCRIIQLRYLRPCDSDIVFVRSPLGRGFDVFEYPLQSLVQILIGGDVLPDVREQLVREDEEAPDPHTIITGLLGITIDNNLGI